MSNDNLPDEKRANLKLDFSGCNPVLVEVTRGGIVESRHRGSIAVVDVQGNVQAAWGDITQPVYGRSSVKAFQALPMLETGAADEFGFSDDEISLSVASHGGEEVHTKTAASMLAKMGLDEDDLECGAHWPMLDEAARELAAKGLAPNQLHNNCSGKHAGMLALAKKLGVDTKGYVEQTHAVQQRIKGTMEFMCGISLNGAAVDRDGCSAPTWAVPLENTAYGFARFAVPDDLPPAKAEACQRIASSVFKHPFNVAGTGRYCTGMMEILKDKVFLKTGAEGFFSAALPEYGLGIALKCDDGSTRGAEAMLTATLRQIGVLDGDSLEKAAQYISVPLTNRRDFQIGEIRPAGENFTF
ncbi:asparaginase [Curvivirga sp.]|uniref:asparaginase n=1 Tax=Curvivirga sp. TaxID=2856848 RepID=UPI003B5AD9A6